jgi:hypothetical protein
LCNAATNPPTLGGDASTTRPRTSAGRRLPDEALAEIVKLGSEAVRLDHESATIDGSVLVVLLDEAVPHVTGRLGETMREVLAATAAAVLGGPEAGTDVRIDPALVRRAAQVVRDVRRKANGGENQ